MQRDHYNKNDNYANKGDKGYPGERKYIIDAKWWRNWCDFTEFDVLKTEDNPS